MPLVDQLDPVLHRAVTERLDWLARPCISLEIGGDLDDPRATSTSSFLGGHPHLPEGASWPQDANGPLVFLVQVNFADFAPLPGFPRFGLLQWFVSNADSYGLTFDATAGAAGFAVRWYDPADTSSSAAPGAPVPTAVEYPPIEMAGLLVGTPARSLPEWNGLPEVAKQDPIWTALGQAAEEGDDDPAFCYNEFARGSHGFGVQAFGSRIGGFPSFTQEDPHGIGAYATPGSPASSLLVELDSGDVGGWGDAGIAHLFGDPRRIGYGDLGSVRYHWDCL